MNSTPSKLDAVTVYRQGAVCRRVAPIGPQAGTRITFTGLPTSLEAGSLRALVLSGSARVLDVRAHFDVQLVEDLDLPAEQKAVEAAKRTVDRLSRQRARLAREITELEKLRPHFPKPKRGEPPRDASVEPLLALAEFGETELSVRLERRRRLEADSEEAERELQLRQHRLGEASTARRTERAKISRAAVVTIDAPCEGVLALEYIVPGARWVPSYQLRLARGLTEGALSMRASVAQHTGEDWSDVSLSLSTASLSRRTDVPELRALKIGRQQPPPPRSGWREPPPGLDELFAGYDAAFRGLLPSPGRSSAVAAGPGAIPAKGRKQDDEEVAKLAKPAPPMPSAPKLRRSVPSAAPAAAPMRARSLGGGGPEAGGFEPQAELEESVMADFAAEGAAFEPAPPPPPAGPTASQLDYSTLYLAGLEQGPQRGRLQPMGDWGAVMSFGVSVQLEVVVAAFSAAQTRARSLTDLPVPANCVPVSGVDEFDYRYDCQARAEVASTGQWVSVAVSACDVGLSPEYVCVPAVEPKVYRTLQVRNRSPHALLPGPVDVSLGDEFLLTSRLPAMPPHAEVGHRLGLGVEEAIKVARKTGYKESSGGFLGGSTVLPHELEIEINNRLSTPALIEVRERIPTVAPEDEKDLRVEEQQVQPAWEKIEGLIDGVDLVRGARRWRVSVGAAQSLKLSAQFTIRMPSDRMLVGGNRRA